MTRLRNLAFSLWAFNRTRRRPYLRSWWKLWR